jgi:hypothetical protein
MLKHRQTAQALGQLPHNLTPLKLVPKVAKSQVK